MIMKHNIEEVKLTRKERILEEKQRIHKTRKLKVAKYALAGSIAASALLHLPKQNVSAEAGLYVVQKGDTLSLIASKYGVTVKQLQEVNQLNTTIIKIGQRIEVPTHRKYFKDEEQENLPSYINYKIQKRDTLSAIAKSHGMPLVDIKQLNGLNSDLIVEGQQLLIPKTNVLNKKEKVNYYNVKLGDSLTKLANQFNSKVSLIKEVNNLNSDLLQIGQTLIIPEENRVIEENIADATYVVEPGDTLWGIARRFNTTIESIKAQNRIDRNYILIGEKLTINENNIYKITGKVVGAIDNSSIEVVSEGKEMVLEVAYGTAQNYQKIAGHNITLFFQKSNRPALVSFLFDQNN